MEFARHGRNAWLVQPNSSAAMADGLRRLIDDEGLRRSLAAGGLATAAERKWDLVYDRLLEDYRAAIENGRLIRAA
jgi:glycosyltransferase involved in cell wall biosynthesis